MNKVILIGRVANDVRIFTTPSGIKYARTSIAVSRRTDATNPITDFIPIIAWRFNADTLNNYAPKGSLICIEGSINVSRYEGKNGLTTSYDVVVDNITLLESRRMREEREKENLQASGANNFYSEPKTSQYEAVKSPTKNIKPNFEFPKFEDDEEEVEFDGRNNGFFIPMNDDDDDIN
ncbi:single-stranded DNA-binding protein [Mycoplasmopsis gallinarum]|uniref:Single-stranded DNA-binding protein n=1 Tax=Mycoplasmopsis gallinarum TaxID=29557 RepID=A0A168RDC2_9BACT|nr:single-stranded DNA-binding protein [Mycoplasmopsis gallinarum]OAB48864.1 Single-stranded DNA-binding protein [Mycoplasmopsis gallinarum]